MNRKSFVTKIILFFFILTCISNRLTSETNTSTTPEPYSSNEFPIWMKDLRRAEIITFGSLPFVTLGVTLGFGTYQYFAGELSSFPNPLNKSSQTFSSDDQIKILTSSCLISLGLGISDFVINSIINKNKEKKRRIIDQQNKTIINVITPEQAGNLLKEINIEDNPEILTTDDEEQIE